MASNFFVFDHNAKPLTEIDAATTPRSWVMNDVGRNEFSMSVLDPKTTETILQYGNLVHVKHLPTVLTENGNVVETKGTLADWTGMILPPRVWNAGVLNCTAYTAEALLTFRPMPLTKITGTPADMFRQILSYANQLPGVVPILPGQIENINKTFSDDLSVSAYEHIIKLIKMAGMTWNVTGEIDSVTQQLVLSANLFAGSGTITNLTLTNQNSELRSPIMTEQGTPTNVIQGYSFAHTQRGRYPGAGVHQGALADYGYMGKNVVFSGLHDPSSVSVSAQAQADVYGRPPRIMARTGLDINDTFDFLRIGNFVNIHETGAGFKPGGGFGMDGLARILSISYSDLQNKADLNLELIYA